MSPGVPRLPVWTIALAVAAVAGPGGAGTDSDISASACADFTRGLIELKRQATDRGTTDETTKTNLKFDAFPSQGVVSLLRLEVPLPDEQTTFAGSAIDPDLGDARVRVGFRAVEVGALPLTSFFELGR
jgi:hypothetical protein